MALTRWQRPGFGSWSPVRQLTALRDEIDRLFDTPFANLATGTHQLSSGWVPMVDVYEDPDNLTVQVELPGMKKDELNISLHQGLLTISGERKEGSRYEGAEVYRGERFLGRFQRTFSLPVPVDGENVKATFVDGILSVTLPKREEAKPKQIEVKLS